MTLTFDYISNNEEKNQIRKLSEYIRASNYAIQYKTPYGIETKSASLFFDNSSENNGYNSEAILSLLYFIRLYLKDKMFNFVEAIDNLLFSWNDYNIFWSPDQDFKVLVGAEAFIRGLGWMLYKDQTVIVGNTEVDCYKGNTENCILGIHDETFSNLLNGVIAKGKVKLPPITNNRAGLVDKKNDTFRYLSETLMGLRNNEVHKENNPKYDYEREKKSFFIRMDITVLIMLIVQYQYDSLYKIVSYLIPKLNRKHLREEIINPLQIISNQYIPNLLDSQLDIIGEAYKFYSFTREIECPVPDSVNVMLRPISLSDDIDSFDNDYAVDEDDLTEELEEEPLCLLDRPEQNKLFIGGTSGSGKSTVIAKMIKELCLRWENDINHDKESLPIRLNIGDFDRIPGNIDNKIITAIANSIGYLEVQEKDSIARYYMYLREQGRLILFFDGINEAGKNTDAVINAIMEYCEDSDFNNCRCVVTSRIIELGKKIKRFSDFFAYELCPLNTILIKEQMKRASDFFHSENLWERISISPKLRDLASNPQQLKLLIELMGVSEDRLSNLNKTILFDQVVRKLMEKKYDSRIYEDELNDFNQVLCCVSGMIMEKGDMIEVEEFKDYGSERFVHFPHHIHRYLNDAIEIGIIRGIYPFITFTHDSWKEFYQAIYVRDMWLAADIETRHKQANILRQILLGDDNEQISLSIGLINSLYELLDKEMEERVSKKKYSILIDLTALLLTPSNVNAEVSLDNNVQTDVCLYLNDNHFPSIDKTLRALAIAISNMNYNPASFRLNSKGLFPSDPKSVVVGMIINLLLLYRKSFPNGMVGCNINTLAELFSISAICGNTSIIKELFHPYWLRLWLIQSEDFDNLMGFSSAHKDDWQKRPYENRVALPNESKILGDRLLKNSTNKTEFFWQLYSIQNEFYKLGLQRSAIFTKHYITRLLMRMSNQDLHETIKLCNNHKNRLSDYGNYAALLLEDVDSMKKNFVPQKSISIPNSLINKLIQRIEENDIADFLWAHQCLLKSKTIGALIQIGYQPLLEACRSGNIKNLDLNFYADSIPLSYLPVEFIESHYDISIFRHWPIKKEETIYKENLISIINWDEPSHYHSSTCDALLPYLVNDPTLATKKVWEFFDSHSQSASYTRFYINLSIDSRRQAWCPSPNVCHVLSVSNASILLFSPSKGYETDGNLQMGIEWQNGYYGNTIKAGDLVIIEHNKVTSPLPSQESEAFYGFKTGFVKAISGIDRQDFFIGVTGMNTDFYYHCISGNNGEMEKGEKVVFFPSVNLRYNGQVCPMAYNLKILREQIRFGVLEYKNLEIISERLAYKLRIRDGQTGDLYYATLFQEFHPSSSLEYIEKLQTGQTVQFRNYAYRNRCNIIIPNKL